LGRREGKYHGEGTVTEEAARIIKERGIRRYTFWEEGKVTAEADSIIKERLGRYTF
jgi:hypothetical protein